MEPRLVGIQGARIGESFSLAQPVTIGRDPACSISIQDQTLSRHHARVSQTAQGVLVEDTGSANGVLIAGQRISGAVVVQPGTEFSLGAQAFRIDVLGPSVRPIEVSSSERATQAQTTSPMGQNNGCLPLLNDLENGLSGIMPFLLRLFPWLLAALLALVILMLFGKVVMAGIDMIGHRDSAGQSSPPTQSPEKNYPPQDQPPSDTDKKENSAQGIRIVSAAIEITSVGPLIKIEWENGTKTDVQEVKADVTVKDQSGEEILKLDNVVVFQGKAVHPGDRHTPGKYEGISVPLGVGNGKVKVVPLSVR